MGQEWVRKVNPRVKTGGIKSAADLLNWFDKEEGKELLKSIEKRNPKLGGSIRQRMFRFEDLVRLSPGDVSKITKEVDQDDLVIALKNASPELKKIIYSTMSKRAVEALEEQLSFLVLSVCLKLNLLKIGLFKSYANSRRTRRLSLILEEAALSYNRSILFRNHRVVLRLIILVYRQSLRANLLRMQFLSTSVENKRRRFSTKQKLLILEQNMPMLSQHCFPILMLKSLKYWASSTIDYQILLLD